MAEAGTQVWLPSAWAADRVHSTVARWVVTLVAVTETVPVGAPAAAGATVTIGVKVAAVSCPTTTVAGVSVRTVVVTAGVTVSVWAEETEPVKLVSPE